MIHVPPAYLRDPITLRLTCHQCQKTRLHRCKAIGIVTLNQQVETVCLHCEKVVVK